MPEEQISIEITNDVNNIKKQGEEILVKDANNPKIETSVEILKPEFRKDEIVIKIDSPDNPKI